MKTYLNKIAYPDYPAFRKKVLQELHWTDDQYDNRLKGRTKISHAERLVLEQITNQFKNP